MNIDRTLVKQAGFYFISFIGLGLPGSYMQTYLQSLGYSVVQRGIVISCSALCTIAFQFFAGYLCDKFSTNKKVYNALILITIVCVFILYQIENSSFLLCVLFASLISGIVRTANAIQDAWTLEVNEGMRSNYGAIRAFGAIGWMIGSPLGAFVIQNYGYKNLGWVFTVLALMNFAYTFFIQDAQKAKKSTPTSIKDIGELFQSKDYLRIVCILFLINLIASADTYTTVEKMMMLGASEVTIGLRWSIQAMVELPLFFAGAYLLRKFVDINLLLFGISMYILRFIGYSLAQTTNTMILVTCLQCVTFPLIMISSKVLIAKSTPTTMKSSGQTIAVAIAEGIPMLITPLLSSVLISISSVDSTLFIFALIGILPFILGLMTRKQMMKK
ncbi:MAG: MFS transporter [Erysipelotrichaceae bacterium]